MTTEKKSQLMSIMLLILSALIAVVGTFLGYDVYQNSKLEAELSKTQKVNTLLEQQIKTLERQANDNQIRIRHIESTRFTDRDARLEINAFEKEIKEYMQKNYLRK